VVLVLTYHSVSEGPPPLCVSPERLAEQLDFLCGLGLEAISLRELVTCVRAGRSLPEKSFAITFDDGYRDFRESALPVLEARGLPATLFALALENPSEEVPGGLPAPALSRDELRDVAARGVEVGAHSLSHCDLTRVDDAQLERELVEGRHILEGWVGSPVASFAYPFGRFDDRVRRACGAHFEAGFTTQLASVGPGVDGFAIPRVDAFYLDSKRLRSAIAAGRPERYLKPRRWLRRIRGSEPRRSG